MALSQTNIVSTDSSRVSGLEGAEWSRFEGEVVQIFVDLMRSMGLPKSYGEIYGLLYASPAPLCFTEITTRLDISKGSVSGGLKALREIGAVRLEKRSDERREFYSPETELRKLIMMYIEERLEPQLASNIARMEQLDALLEQTEFQSTDRRVLQGRLAKLGKWRRKASGLLPWIRKFLG